MADASLKTRVLSWAAAILFGATVLSASAAMVMALNARANTGDDGLDPRPPLTVEVATLNRVPEYTVREGFVGRVEPARETDLAAERAGLVTEIMVDEGDKVAAGAVLVQLDVRPLEIERQRLLAERASLDADLELARATTSRRETLASNGWSSSQAFDEARFSVTALSARRDAVDAAIARVALDLEKSVITAPFSGEIARRMIDEGAVVAAGTPMVRLQEVHRPQARIGVPPGRAKHLSRGAEVEVSAAGQTLKGRVASVTSDLEPGTRTVPVLVDLPADSGLAMGEIVRLTLERPVTAQGAWVDLSALQEAERGLWSIKTVAPADGGHVVAREAVEILHVAGARAFVRGAFLDGAQVVPIGAHRLTPGQQVALAAETR
ncbi:MAG: efflux RND transporter periplasmic adaptor subunit [Pseudomonadota bacterium]